MHCTQTAPSRVMVVPNLKRTNLPQYGYGPNPDGKLGQRSSGISRHLLQADSTSIKRGHYLGYNPETVVKVENASSFEDREYFSLWDTAIGSFLGAEDRAKLPEVQRGLLQSRFIDVHQSLLKAKRIWTDILVCVDTNTTLPEQYKVQDNVLNSTYRDLISEEGPATNYHQGLTQLNDGNNGLSKSTCESLLKAIHAYRNGSPEESRTVVSNMIDSLAPPNGRVEVSRLFQEIDFLFSAICDHDYPEERGYKGSVCPIGLLSSQDDVDLYRNTENLHKEFMRDWLVWVLICLTKVNDDRTLGICTPEEVIANKSSLQDLQKRSLAHYKDVPETNSEMSEPSEQELTEKSLNLAARQSYPDYRKNPLGEKMTTLLADIPVQLNLLRQSTTISKKMQNHLIKELEKARKNIKTKRALENSKQERHSFKDAAKLVRDSIKKKKRNRKTQSAPTEVTPSVSTKVIKSAPAELLPRQQLTEQVKTHAFNANVFG